MIIDMRRFVAREQPFWEDLAGLLDGLEKGRSRPFDVDELVRLNDLFRRASTDLVRVRRDAGSSSVVRFLEALVARAFVHVHERRPRPGRFALVNWFVVTFPRTFRRHLGAFVLSFAVVSAGAGFGAVMLRVDAEARTMLLPGFLHLRPAERVRMEESASKDRLGGQKMAFSGFLMTHNIRVSLATFALGLTAGIGSVLMLFYNGVILGAVACDYVGAGHTRFLLGWLMPHGAVEIPAILVAGQAAMVLAGALIGRGAGGTLGARVERVGADLATLLGGLAVLLVWAGLVEAFLSQYHEPHLPYIVKIAFGLTEIAVLISFLLLSGRGAGTGEST